MSAAAVTLAALSVAAVGQRKSGRRRLGEHEPQPPPPPEPQPQPQPPSQPRRRPGASPFNPFRWFGGDANWGPDRPQAPPGVQAFPLAACPAPKRKLRLGYVNGSLANMLDSSAAGARIFSAVWLEAGKIPGVTLVPFPVGVRLLPDGIDAFFGSCPQGMMVSRAPTTWMISKVTEEVYKPYCRCGCGPRHKRFAVWALNKAQQQLWEAAGGAALELSLTEPPVLPCTRRARPEGPVRVCFMGFHHHAYDLLVGPVQHLLSDSRVQLIFITPAQLGWFRDAFQALNFTERGIPMERITMVPGRGKDTVWKAMNSCHVGLVPQWSQSNPNDTVYYPHFKNSSKFWSIAMMSTTRVKMQGQAGRAFMFTQLGIPVIAEAESQTLSIYPEHRLGVTIEAGAPVLWRWAFERVMDDYEGFSRRSCEYARTHLQPAVEARKLVCWLRHWQSRIEREPEAGVITSKRPPEPFAPASRRPAGPPAPHAEQRSPAQQPRPVAAAAALRGGSPPPAPRADSRPLRQPRPPPERRGQLGAAPPAGGGTQRHPPERWRLLGTAPPGRQAAPQPRPPVVGLLTARDSEER
eukprot:TRINITY_DN2319_c2_g1_i1.p1 TRINITY_DN2319_c2_g1~~TRINITY_DN2319_c2_g1_i1.p1  ORF type:complete len:601 (+),score=107.05 TRINITY_DN2319_c2_g1_i1:70-1803(+)